MTLPANVSPTSVPATTMLTTDTPISPATRAIALLIAEAIPAFLKADVSQSNPSIGAWATATRAGLGLIARGRLLPTKTDEGYDGWRVAPLDEVDEHYLRRLAHAFPPEAHALPVKGSKPSVSLT